MLPFLSLSRCYTTSILWDLFWKLLQYKWIVRAFSLCSSHPFSPAPHPSSTSSTLLRPRAMSPVSQRGSSGFKKPNLTVLKTFFGQCSESKYRNRAGRILTKPTVNRCKLYRYIVIPSREEHTSYNLYKIHVQK